MNSHKWTIIRNTYALLLSPVCLTIWIVATVVAIVAGPFGTFSALDFLQRLAYWGLISGTSIFLGYVGVAISNMIWKEDRIITQTVVGGALAIVIISTNVWAISRLQIWGTGPRPSFGLLLSYITLIAAAATLVKYLANKAIPWQKAEVDRDETAPPAPRLLRRIPKATDDTVLHLSVQDHFVDITTATETVSVRMRFRDALDELDGLEGMRVHRSHWVAKSAIEQVEKDQARLFLKLINGTRVPVSRNYRPALEDAGLI